jgi:4-amino-4-deoxy-L-arabinose transferase-like glycosyltransferase
MPARSPDLAEPIDSGKSWARVSVARLGDGPAKAGRAIALLAALAALIVLSGVSTPLPYVNAEQRNGEISSTMYATGDLLVPRLEGKAHLTKPPLFHWFSYAVSCLRGEGGLVSARIVAAIGAIGTVVFTFLLGRLLLGRQAAWYGACMLLSNGPLFVHHAHRGTFDTTLTAFILLSLYGYASLDGQHPRRARILLLLGLVGGFLVKGPVAWFLPGVPMVIDSVRQRGPRRTALGALLLIPVVIVLSLPWYVALVLRVPEARQVFLDAVRVNFGDRSQVYDMAFHREPLLFYLWQFPLCMLPWAVFLPALRPRELWRPGGGEAGRASALLPNGLLWGLLFFTLVPAKAARYLVPLAPLFCLTLGRWFADRRDRPPAELPWLRRLWMVQAAVLSVATIGLPIWLWVRLGEGAPGWASAAGILAICAILAWRWRHRVTVPLFAGTALLLAVLALPLVYQRWLPRNQYLKEHKHSPAREAYRARLDRLSSLFGKTKHEKAAPPEE